MVAILSFAIGIPSIIGLVRFTKIDRAYYPFLYAIWLGFINEIISFMLIRNGKSNAINSNIYVLFEALLLSWFFKKQGSEVIKEKVYRFFIVVLILFWGYEKFVYSSITRFSSYFNVFYSFALVILGINLINVLLVRTQRVLARNPLFIISMCLVLFYTCSILIEIFWIYGLNASRDFRVEVYRILTYVNLLVNLLYILAVLWMPRRQEFTWP